MFWGLTMEAQKRYTQVVVESFHVSQAVLDLNSVGQETTATQIVLEYESNDYVLANLSKNAKIYQVPLDLNFQKGDRVSFRTVGPGVVHLSGYHVFDDDDLESRLMAGDDSDEDDDEEEMMENSVSDYSTSGPPGKRKKVMPAADNNKKTKLQDSDSDEDDEEEEGIGSTLGESTLLDLEAEEDSDEEEDDDDDEEEDEDEDEEDEGEDSEEEEEEQKVSAKKGKQANKNASMNGETPGKKGKLNTSQKEAAKTPKSEKKSEKPNLNQSKQEKTPKQEKKTPKKENKTPSAVTPGSQKKVLEGGVIAEELAVGEGPVAKAGKMARVYYVGRLKSNNKQFDSSTSGSGFQFRVGRGEVIRGWDIGVSGMRVGGKRRLTVPAGLAYGAKGSPPVIPGNATLVFDVELRGVS